MIERLLITILLLAVGLIAYRLWIARQKQTATALVPIDPLLTGMQPGVPVIVYFTTPTCIPCRTQQMPALERLRNEVTVQIVKVDATENSDAADRWGVFSAPTTFVIDGRGVTRAVNHGVADFHTLKTQLQE
ncbi:MAG: thioredoxin family protein [Anaerolinea sp.]|nr:thioredoxin family protein [Anaerolinea sp.]